MHVYASVSLYRHRGADGLSAAPPTLDQLAFPLLSLGRVHVVCVASVLHLTMT